ncbi:HD domain-containing protein [Micromonospora tulbaghiae]|uniref:HD domain-containing protein n=1 Tax=Micromonospora tulbaghiae TaxID=479978 RepID=A0AAW4JKD0_9ACTN|nr:HD domain-containing protein [Micromonospora tulbaghiae]MBO4139304.1 HD domain-containing protein [Micromonospora tulbaghiae]
MMSIVHRAAEASELHLAAPLPRRWRHVQGVAAKARTLVPIVGTDGDLLVAAAWLHDIGYAPGIVDTGFHSLDGARWLRNAGFGLRLASLVAHHSCASYEAEERGLAAVLTAEFPMEESATSDSLWYADMTTGPDGNDVSPGDRLAEIRRRYGPNHLVTRFWHRAEPALMEAVDRTEARMRAQPM